MRHLAPIVLLPLASACGSGASSSGSAASTTAADLVPGPPQPWAELSHAERQQYMVREVLPRMAALFAEYDRTRYADFDCATCHGGSGPARGYAMPNPDLLPLWPSGTEGQHETVRRYPEGVRFMFNRVVPTMRALLGQPEYDAETHTGLTCFACHPHAEAGAGTNAGAGG